MDYTKGEWKVFRFSKHHNWKVTTSDDNWFVDCGIDGEANAQLIASAPDLYEALKVARIRLLDEGFHPENGTVLMINKALAKAESK